MYIIRDTFTAKPGQASKLAKLFKRAFVNETKSRIMTDLVGSYNTVVMEFEVANLAEYDEMINNYKAGKLNIDPAVADEMKNYTQLWDTGRREIFQVVE